MIRTSPILKREIHDKITQYPKFFKYFFTKLSQFISLKEKKKYLEKTYPQVTWNIFNLISK